ncbi:uracil-DNA glycosylase [candidate division KSB1 bacterium]|nr:uracil-DNA glycosylase [candidate division KSB1 bacterium]
MSSLQHKISELLDDLEDYFRNQRELYGNDLYTEKDLDAIWKSPQEIKGRALDDLYREVHDCQRCGLASKRKNVVFGDGNPDACIMLIGEAPGREEDIQGKVFVGDAGKLLTNILAAIQLEREDIYITNILKCRPPQNRDPQQDEQSLCSCHLFRQIEIIRPRFILALGRIAGQFLTGESDSNMNELRNRVFTVRGAQLMVTYHPAALLRNTELKRPTWEDVQKFQKLYEQ